MLIYPRVAGKFYPDDPKMLQQMLFKLFAQVSDKATLPTPKVIIAPHAGYVYSGKIAAAAYAAFAKV